MSRHDPTSQGEVHRRVSSRTGAVLTSRVAVPEQVLVRDLGSQAVVLHLESGTYYELNEVGLRMLVQLKCHGRVETAYRALLDEFAVGDDELRDDLLSFVDLLAAHELLEIDP